MQIDLESRFPVPSDQVIRAFTDRAFHERKLAALKLSHFAVLAHEWDGQNFRLRVERKMPIELPGLGKSGMDSSVVNDEFWTLASKTGRVQVETPGLPLKMSCTMRMSDQAGGSTVHYRWEIKASIPLIGGKLEKFVAGDIETRAAQENSIAVALLRDAK